MDTRLRPSLVVVTLLVALPCAAQQPPGLYLRGKVKGAFDNSATVIVDDPEGTAVWHAHTAKDGSFAVGPLPQGRYRVCAEGARYDAVVKRMTIDSTTKPISLRLNSAPHLDAAQCPSVGKALLALTPAEMKRAWLLLQDSEGTWTGAGYSVRIDVIGGVSVNGPNFHPECAQGSVPTLRRHMDADEVNRLLKHIYSMLAASGFASLPTPSRVSVIMDAPTVTLSFGIDGMSKSVQHMSGAAPKELLAIESEILASADVRGWLLCAPEDESLLGGVREDLLLPKPGMTPLLRAAGTADLETFKRLISEGQDPQAVDSSGWSALMIAASEGNEEILEYLLGHGADPNVKSLRKETALMAAAGGWSGDVSGIKALLVAGADPNAENNEGETALIWAARRARPSAIEALLAAHADINHRSKSGSSALGLLRNDLGDRSKECAELLRAAGATK